MSAERVTDLDDARKRRQLEEDRVRRSTDYEMGKDFIKKSRFNPANLSVTTLILSVWTLTLVVCTIILVAAR